MIVFLNGQFIPEEQALISVFDRSFLYGDGLFETILVANGRPFRWSQHMARLESGAAFLGIALPFGADKLTQFAAHLICQNQMSNALLRLTLSRGVGHRGYSPRSACSPCLVMTIHEFPVLETQPPQNWHLRTSEFRLPANQVLAQYKTCNKLTQILARAHAEQTGADEALLENTDGFIVEGASSNLFWIDQGAVCTPPITSGILSGVTRSVVLEICASLRLAAQERNVIGSSLVKADGVFLSLSSAGIVQGASLDGRAVRTSPLTQRIQAAYCELVRRETAAPP